MAEDTVRHSNQLLNYVTLFSTFENFTRSNSVLVKISASMKELQSGGNQEFVSVFGCCKEKWKCKDRAKGEWQIFLLEKALNSCLNTHLEACISKS
jgi:hypothetical protein